jgi:hypothetical protein
MTAQSEHTSSRKNSNFLFWRVLSAPESAIISCSEIVYSSVMSLDVQATFKVPEALPQDLLLIRDLVGELSVSHATNASPVTKSEAEEDDINSSSSEDDSEDELDEVEANLDVKSEEDDGVSPAKA